MKKIIVATLLIFSLLGLLKIFSIVPFNRMAGDDYSSATIARDGYWNSVIFTYKGFMGRFSAVMLETPFSSTLAEKGNIIIYSVITFVSLLISLFVLLKRVFKMDYKNLLLYLLTAVCFVFLYQITPNKSESWYWLTGSVVYLWPIIFFSFAVSFLFLDKYKKMDYIAATSIIFFSVAFNETFGLFVVLLLIGALVLLWKNNTKRKFAITMLVSALTSFLIVFLSPGNEVRKSNESASPMSLLGSVLYSLGEGPNLYFSLISSNSYLILPLIVVISSAFSMYAGFNKKTNLDFDKIVIHIFLTILAGIFLSVVFMLPSFIGLGRIQPDRSVLSLSYVIILQVVAVSYFVSQITFNKAEKTQILFYKLIIFISAIFLLKSSTVFTSTLASDIYIAKNYSYHLDAMIANFKEVANSSSPDRQIEVSLPESGFVAELIDPPGKYSYKNLSLSQYYKIGKVITINYEEK